MNNTKKLLLIMRHAESNQAPPNSSDLERPLNAFGKVQPEKISNQLNSLNINLDSALVSTSCRTKETYELLQKFLTRSPSPNLKQELYNASLIMILDLLKNNLPLNNNILILGHCPGVDKITYYLCGYKHFFAPADLLILSQIKTNNHTHDIEENSFSLEHILRAK